MTKMDMVWVAVATIIHPRTAPSVVVTKSMIDSTVAKLFGETITPVMINRHVVNSEDRQADRDYPQRGGSRNRYLVRGEHGDFRLYKLHDSSSDAWDKTGPTHPDPNRLDADYVHLVTWYENEYVNSYGNTT